MQTNSSINNSAPDYKDWQSLAESAAICASVIPFLRIALGEVLSLNVRSPKPVFDEKTGKRLLDHFKYVINDLKKAHDEFTGLSAIARRDFEPDNGTGDKATDN